MRTPTRLLLLTATTALLAAALAAPATAAGPAGVEPSTPSQAAWVTVRSPGLTTSIPAAKDQGNTTGKLNRVIRKGVGRWQVRFPGIGSGAVPQVVAMNTKPRRCQITGFGRNAVKRYAWVNVACFRPGGIPADTRFVATTVRKGTSGDAARFLGLAYADQPTAPAPYAPLVRRSSTNGAVEVERLGVGRYLVRFGTTPDDLDSIALATAVSPALQPRACQATDWSHAAGTETIVVDCQNDSGVAADSAFTVQFTIRGGLEGLLRGPNASLWNSTATSPTPWTPSASYDYSSADKASRITQLATGVYRVTLKGMPAGGAAIVNAYTDGLVCQLGAIRTSGTPQQVEVRCFIFNGTTADTQFQLAYTR
jgi:hypothetical protein